MQLYESKIQLKFTSSGQTTLQGVRWSWKEIFCVYLLMKTEVGDVDYSEVIVL